MTEPIDNGPLPMRIPVLCSIFAFCFCVFTFVFAGIVAVYDPPLSAQRRCYAELAIGALLAFWMTYRWYRRQIKRNQS
jgi:amino acid permease